MEAHIVGIVALIHAEARTAQGSAEGSAEAGYNTQPDALAA